MSFAARLFDAVRRKQTPAVVGLDPRPDHLPPPFADRARFGAAACAEAYAEYLRDLLDVLAARVPAVKPNTAFFEPLGAAGWKALAETLEGARERKLLVILDAKRGDIGSTAEAYARAFLSGGWEGGFPPSDALTVNPYLGEDACQPFLEAAAEAEAGLFFLVKTSNPGAGLFQDHGDPPLAEHVATAVAQWGADRVDESGWSSIGAVVGATRPEELARFRELLPRNPLLLPGFGFQGGGATGLEAAFDTEGRGAVVNASRSILWAHEREDLQHFKDWQDRVDAAVQEMVEQLRPLASGCS